MRIEETDINFSEEEKKALYAFFIENLDWIKETDLSEYKNVEKFADKYNEYLINNNLLDNDILKLFLAELRCCQLTSKTTDTSLKRKLSKSIKSLSSDHISNEIIAKWYRECMVITTIGSEAKVAINKELTKKLNENRRCMRADIDSSKYKY